MRAIRLAAIVSLLELVAAVTSRSGVLLHAQRSGDALPSFRSGVDLVQLDVVVLDKNRQPVTGLTAADFTVFEDGHARPLQAFAPITLPASPRADAAGARIDEPRTIEFHSDVATNQRAEEGRLVVIVLDRTIDVGQPTIQARQIAHAIVNALGPDDLASVVRTSLFSHDGGQQNLTEDRQRLHRILNDSFMGMTHPPEMSRGGLLRNEDNGLDDQVGECPRGLCTLETLASVAAAMGNDPRRQKVIFFIGTQIAFQDADIDPSGQTPIARQRVLDNLARSNVTVHVLDPRGLQTLIKGAEAFGSDPGAAARVRGNLARQSALGVLPAYTGGRTVLNTNGPEAWVPELLNEGRIYYLLAFGRANTTDDGRIHRFKVVVNRSGVSVRARSGYVATRPKPSGDIPVDPATQATRGLLPIGDIPLSLVTMPVFEDGFVRAAVGIGVPTEPSGARRNEHFNVVVAALDDHANLVSSQATSFGGDSLKDDALQQSIRILVKPGRYEIRVGVTSSSGATGSVYGNVDVPDIGKQDVALSGAVFLPVPEDVPMVPVLLVPSVTRRFDTTSPTSVFWQLFRRGGQPVHMTAAVTDERNQVIVRTEGVLDVGEKGAALVTTHRLKLPTSRMAPGRYQLQLTATDGRTIDRRGVAFEVR